jgi:hypothetical protein
VAALWLCWLESETRIEKVELAQERGRLLKIPATGDEKIGKDCGTQVFTKSIYNDQYRYPKGNEVKDNAKSNNDSKHIRDSTLVQCRQGGLDLFSILRQSACSSPNSI